MKRDGPSLWISEPGKAGRRVPARLISRVVIIGNMRLETDVLVLMAEHGVPITFLSSAGDAKAIVLPLDMKSSTIKERQQVLCDDDDARERGIMWIEAWRRKNRMDFLRRLAPTFAREVALRGLRDVDYETYLRTYLPPNRPEVATVRQTICGLVHELILALINKAGLDPHYGLLNRRTNFGFCKDILSAFDPIVDEQTIRFFEGKEAMSHIRRDGKRYVLTGTGYRSIICRFENQRQRIEGKIDIMLEEFFRLLRT